MRRAKRRSKMQQGLLGVIWLRLKFINSDIKYRTPENLQYFINLLNEYERKVGKDMPEDLLKALAENGFKQGGK